MIRIALTDKLFYKILTYNVFYGILMKLRFPIIQNIGIYHRAVLQITGQTRTINIKHETK